MEDSTTSSDTDLVGFENETVEKDNEQKLMIGTCFDDATSFKNFLRTVAIKANFTLKIEVSNKRRIVAVCSHAGCPWRVRVALCSDSKTYEGELLHALGRAKASAPLLGVPLGHNSSFCRENFSMLWVEKKLQPLFWNAI